MAATLCEAWIQPCNFKFTYRLFDKPLAKMYSSCTHSYMVKKQSCDFQKFPRQSMQIKSSSVHTKSIYCLPSLSLLTLTLSYCLNSMAWAIRLSVYTRYQVQSYVALCNVRITTGYPLTILTNSLENNCITNYYQIQSQKTKFVISSVGACPMFSVHYIAGQI